MFGHSVDNVLEPVDDLVDLFVRKAVVNAALQIRASRHEQIRVQQSIAQPVQLGLRNSRIRRNADCLAATRHVVDRLSTL
jgi:hypothetical protein